MKYLDEFNNTYWISWSNDLEKKTLQDFIIICNKVFGNNTMSEERFRKKFYDNIYGPSVIVVVYNNQGGVIGARSLWRNDISNNIAYQPCDTCISEEARGKGIFKKMTEFALKYIGNQSIVYNYPNSNSINGYLKMGWVIVKEYRLKFLFTKSCLDNLNIDLIDDDYVNWWLMYNEKKNIFYFKYKNKTYLVINKNNYGVIIGNISNGIDISRLQYYYGLLFYRTEDVTFYNKTKRPIFLIAKNNNQLDIPFYKMDAIS